MKQPGFYFSSPLTLLQVFCRRVALFALCFRKIALADRRDSKEADAATAIAAAVAAAASAQRHLQPKRR